jgi:hypothetical protein
VTGVAELEKMSAAKKEPSADAPFFIVIDAHLICRRDSCLMPVPTKLSGRLTGILFEQMRIVALIAKLK